LVRGVAGAPVLLATLQPFDNLIVNAIHLGGKVLVSKPRIHDGVAAEFPLCTPATDINARRINVRLVQQETHAPQQIWEISTSYAA
jgi:hypothetical protein